MYNICDGHSIECDDYSDENLVTCKNCYYTKHDLRLWPCKDKSNCVDKYLYCNGKLDCPDGSDENESWCKNCDRVDYLPCPGNPNYYIPQDKFCDGKKDWVKVSCLYCNPNSFSVRKCKSFIKCICQFGGFLC